MSRIASGNLAEIRLLTLTLTQCQLNGLADRIGYTNPTYDSPLSSPSEHTDWLHFRIVHEGARLGREAKTPDTLHCPLPNASGVRFIPSH